MSHHGQSSPTTAAVSPSKESEGQETCDVGKVPRTSPIITSLSDPSRTDAGGSQASRFRPITPTQFTAPIMTTPGEHLPSQSHYAYRTSNVPSYEGSSPMRHRNGKDTPRPKDSDADVDDFASSPSASKKRGQFCAAGLGLTGKRALTPPRMPKGSSYRPGPIDTRHTQATYASGESLREPLPSTLLPSIEQRIQGSGPGEGGKLIPYALPFAANYFGPTEDVPLRLSAEPMVLQHEHCQSEHELGRRQSPHTANGFLSAGDTSQRHTSKGEDEQNDDHQPNRPSMHTSRTRSTNIPPQTEGVSLRPASPMQQTQIPFNEPRLRTAAREIHSNDHEPPFGYSTADPYMDRADEIGLDHGLSGIGHIGRYLKPENWKVGSAPVSPREIESLFQDQREDARNQLQAPSEDDAGLAEEDRQNRVAFTQREWLKTLNVHRFIRNERIKIYEDWMKKNRKLHRAADVILHSDTSSFQDNLTHMINRPPREGDSRARVQRTEAPGLGRTNQRPQAEKFETLDMMNANARKLSRQISVVDGSDFTYLKIPQQSRHGHEVQTDSMSGATYYRIKEFLRTALELVEVQHDNWYRERNIPRPPYEHHPACEHRGKQNCVGHVCHVHEPKPSKRTANNQVQSYPGPASRQLQSSYFDPFSHQGHFQQPQQMHQPGNVYATSSLTFPNNHPAGARHPTPLFQGAVPYNAPAQFPAIHRTRNASQFGQPTPRVPQYAYNQVRESLQTSQAAHELQAPADRSYYASRPPQGGSLQPQQTPIYHYHRMPTASAPHQLRPGTQRTQAGDNRSVNYATGVTQPVVDLDAYHANIKQPEPNLAQNKQSGKVAEQISVDGIPKTSTEHGTSNALAGHPPTFRAVYQVGGAPSKEEKSPLTPRNIPKRNLKQAISEEKFIAKESSIFRGRSNRELHGMILSNDGLITESDREVIKRYLVMKFGDAVLDPDWQWPLYTQEDREAWDVKKAAITASDAVEPSKTDSMAKDATYGEDTETSPTGRPAKRPEKIIKVIKDLKKTTETSPMAIEVEKNHGEASSAKSKEAAKYKSVMEAIETGGLTSSESDEDGDEDDLATVSAADKKTAAPVKNKRKAATPVPNKSVKRSRLSGGLRPRKS